MAGLVLVVTLQFPALWETVSEADWSDAYWGFPLNQYGILQILMVFTYSIVHTTAWPYQYVLPQGYAISKTAHVN